MNVSVFGISGSFKIFLELLYCWEI